MVLFSVKRRALPALGLAVALALVSVSAKPMLGLTWDLSLTVQTGVVSGIVLLGLLGSDGALHAVLTRLYGKRFSATYDCLLEYFRDQSGLAIVSGGVLAGAEELLFRGVIYTGLVALGLPMWVAIAVSACLFGLGHLIPDQELWVFSVWAVWEGVLLGIAYALTGSLVAVGLAHGAHDILGFSIFAIQRQT